MAYQDEVLADLPAAFLRFEEASGTLVDSSGNARSGTPHGGLTYGVTGAVGTALQFNDLDAWVEIAGWPSVDTTQPFTYEFWATRTAHGMVLAQSFDTSDRPPWIEGFVDKYSMKWITSATTVALEILVADMTAMHHIAYVWDGTTLIGYLDGAESSRTTPAVLPTSQTFGYYQLNVGVQGSGTSYYGGKVDEVAIYGHAVSATRIKAHYDAGVGITGDVTPPTVTISSIHGTGPVDDIYGSADYDAASDTLTLRGTAADETGLDRVEVSIDGGVASVATGTATWSLGVDVSAWAAGTHTIRAISYDTAGNASATAEAVVWHSPDGIYGAAETAGAHLIPLTAEVYA